uniref:Uncharacterized protein n=1 Tax=Arundo donax TaxID=35708 RepID=A0A0A9A5L2_ARUDO
MATRSRDAAPIGFYVGGCQFSGSAATEDRG